MLYVQEYRARSARIQTPAHPTVRGVSWKPPPPTVPTCISSTWASSAQGGEGKIAGGALSREEECIPGDACRTEGMAASREGEMYTREERGKLAGPEQRVHGSWDPRSGDACGAVGKRGPCGAGQGKAREGKGRQDKAKQSKAKQSKAKQGKAKQSKAKQGKARQGKARQGKAKKSKARQGKAKQSKAKQGRRCSGPTGSSPP